MDMCPHVGRQGQQTLIQLRMRNIQDNPSGGNVARIITTTLGAFKCVSIQKDRQPIVLSLGRRVPLWGFKNKIKRIMDMCPHVGRQGQQTLIQLRMGNIQDNPSGGQPKISLLIKVPHGFSSFSQPIVLSLGRGVPLWGFKNKIKRTMDMCPHVGRHGHQTLIQLRMGNIQDNPSG
ncbi:hypothetical protein CDAR_229511 [Caerostris darwini]|uniref:Uncharacterized protein n=1 Tax=Caerostris darwini TaxID=1538125 RepID=A0AAV4Q222_9ARAC|nr:hypothetical protein CDAR_229511 [Caerostris darwini]